SSSSAPPLILVRCTLSTADSLAGSFTVGFPQKMPPEPHSGLIFRARRADSRPDNSRNQAFSPRLRISIFLAFSMAPSRTSPSRWFQWNA
ncbi:MAG: hypothetical protein ACK56I_07050, partial [bacterium]